MAVPSVTAFADCLKRFGLLSAAQLEELAQLLPRCPNTRALAGELVKKGWLTPYQVNCLLQGGIL